MTVPIFIFHGHIFPFCKALLDFRLLFFHNIFFCPTFTLFINYIILLVNRPSFHCCSTHVFPSISGYFLSSWRLSFAPYRFDNSRIYSFLITKFREFAGRSQLGIKIYLEGLVFVRFNCVLKIIKSIMLMTISQKLSSIVALLPRTNQHIDYSDWSFRFHKMTKYQNNYSYFVNWKISTHQ